MIVRVTPRSPTRPYRPGHRGLKVSPGSRAEAAFTDSFAAEAPWEVSVPDADRGPLSLRWVLVHVIEEYARHNGHADILRERIDGRVGQ